MVWYGVPLQRTGAALAGAAAVVETLRDRGVGLGVGLGDVEGGDVAEGRGAAQSGDADADFAELASGGASPWGALRCGAAEARAQPPCAREQVIVPTKAVPCLGPFALRPIPT